MQTNQAKAQRAVLITFLIVLAGVIYLMSTGESINVNERLVFVANTGTVRINPGLAWQTRKPALVQLLIDDASSVGAPMGIQYVALDTFYVLADTVPDAEGRYRDHVLVYTARDTRGARSSFALNLMLASRSYWVDRHALRQQRTAHPDAAPFERAPACVHSAQAPVGSCLLEGGPSTGWRCRCTTAGTLVP